MLSKQSDNSMARQEMKMCDRQPGGGILIKETGGHCPKEPGGKRQCV